MTQVSTGSRENGGLLVRSYHHHRAYPAWEGSAEIKGGQMWARGVARAVSGDFKGRGRDTGHLRGENFRGKVCDVRRDLPPSQELCHFVAEGVTVVFKEVVGLTSVLVRKVWRTDMGVSE